jgi:hypothetical protein
VLAAPRGTRRSFAARRSRRRCARDEDPASCFCARHDQPSARRVAVGRGGAAPTDDALPFAYFARLRDRLPAQPNPASALLGDLAIARTGHLIARGVDLARQIAEPGMTEKALKRRIGVDEVSRLLDYWRWLDGAARRRLDAGRSPAQVAREIVPAFFRMAVLARDRAARR